MSRTIRIRRGLDVPVAGEPEQVVYPGPQLKHVALQAGHGRRPAPERICRIVVRRLGDLIAADPRIDDADRAGRGVRTEP